MKTISLWQPWASAIALGLKHIETRHWSTNFRGRLAIHAAKRWTRDQKEFAAMELACGRGDRRLPFGAIVAIATLTDVRPSEELKVSVSAIERIYGNYDDGRYGWILEDIVALDEPIPALGRQGFWEWQPPEGFSQ